MKDRIRTLSYNNFILDVIQVLIPLFVTLFRFAHMTAIIFPIFICRYLDIHWLVRSKQKSRSMKFQGKFLDSLFFITVLRIFNLIQRNTRAKDIIQ
jgi:ABC-type transport system involved in cytochrome bd biosynthesis fused ATPase/permease subunit